MILTIRDPHGVNAFVVVLVLVLVLVVFVLVTTFIFVLVFFVRIHAYDCYNYDFCSYYYPLILYKSYFDKERSSDGSNSSWQESSFTLIASFDFPA